MFQQECLVATYIGYYRATNSYIEETLARARSTGSGQDPAFMQKVVDLPLKLPAGCSIMGSFAPMGQSPDAPPAVMIVETNDTSHLQFISTYYQGFLAFNWHPAVSVGANKDQREQWRQTAQAPTQAPTR